MGPEVIMLSLIGLCAIGIYLALKYQQKIKQQAELAWNDKYGNSPIVGHNQSGKIVLRSRQVAELSSTEPEMAVSSLRFALVPGSVMLVTGALLSMVKVPLEMPFT